MSIKMSVITATYNRPEYLRAILESLRLQTFKDFEVIISDDGGQKSAYPIVKEFEKQLDIKYIWQKDKVWRQGEARNLGIKIAYGDILFLSDDDVFYTPTCLEGHYKRQQTKDRIMVYGRIRRHLNLKPEEINKYLLNKYPEGTDDRRYKIFPKNFSVKRKEAFAINGFDRDYSGYYGYEEIDFYERLCKNGVKKVDAPECQALILEIELSKSNRNSERNKKIYIKKIQEIKKGHVMCKRGLYD